MVILIFMTKTSSNSWNDLGQSTVEYILLLAVIVILIGSFLRNDRLKAFLGKDGSFFQSYADVISYQYRYPLPGRNFQAQDSYTGSDHDSFGGPAGTRINISLEPYPRQ